MSTDKSTLQAVAYYRASAKLLGPGPIGQQQQQVRHWAALHDVHIVREFIDREALPHDGPAPPGLAEMIDWIRQQNHIALILCIDETRLHRLQAQAEVIADCGKQIISIAATQLDNSSPQVLDP